MRNLLFIFFMILFSFTGLAQKNQSCNSCNKVGFDYQKQEFVDCNKRAIIENENFTFKLLNVNTFKYKFTIDGETVNYNTENSGVFDIDLDKIKNFSGNKLPINENDIGVEDSELNNKKRAIHKKYDSLLNIQNTIIKNYNELYTVKLFYENLLNLINSDIEPYKKIDGKKELFTKYIGLPSNTDVLDAAQINDYYSTKLNFIKNKEDDSIQFEGFKEIYKNTSLIDSLQVPKKLSKLYQTINKEKFTVSKYFNKPNADLQKVSIEKQEITNKNENNKQIMTINLEVEGGIKIDFSVGLFFSSVADKEYVHKPVYDNQTDNVTGYNLVALKDKPLSYGISSFMHVYCRKPKKLINPTISLGLGIDQNINLKIMPGLGVILGKEKRFILNGGLAIGKSKELSPTQSTNQIYNSKVDVIYAENYNTGWFIAATYNF